jgi:hypothetical protein
VCALPAPAAGPMFIFCQDSRWEGLGQGKRQRFWWEGVVEKPPPLSRRERGKERTSPGERGILLPLPLGEGWGEGRRGAGTCAPTGDRICPVAGGVRKGPADAGLQGHGAAVPLQEIG